MAEDADSWTELKADIADWLNRDDLSAQIPKFIAQAEREFNRVLRVPEMEAVAELAVDAATISLPADFLEMRALTLDSDPKIVLEPMTLAELRSVYAAGAAGKPQNFAIESGSTLVLGPAPDSAYGGRLNYYQTITPLGGDAASNWLLAAHSDVYLAGALWRAHVYLVDEANAARWKAIMGEGLEQIAVSGRRKAYGAAPLRIRAPCVV
jgi:hypothetical protein